MRERGRLIGPVYGKGIKNINIIMLAAFTDELYSSLQEKLVDISQQEKSAVHHAKKSLLQVKAALDQIKDYLKAHPFRDKEEEAQFNKNIQPRFETLNFYFKEIIWIESNIPIGDTFELTAYYRREMEFIRHFLIRHAAQYHCFKWESMELDDSHLPDDCREIAPHLLLSGQDNFTVTDSGLSARFITYEKLQKYLLDRLTSLEEVEMASFRTRKGIKLKWTGEACNLVELAYGIYETKQINYGQVTISDIVQCLEQTFQVNLRGGYRAFVDIRRRKRISYTHYLEQMQDAVRQRIDDADAYVAKMN